MKPRMKNFLSILMILAENGQCTAREITEKDGFSPLKKAKFNRQKQYSRIIEGSKPDKIRGLIDRFLVKEGKNKLVSKPTKQYMLTIYGILYVLHIFDCFSEKTKDGTLKSTLIDSIAKNYSNQIPLIFGKWNFLKKNNFDLKILEKFANSVNPFINLLEQEPYIDEYAIRVFQSGIASEQEYIIPELTMIFFSNQFEHANKYENAISKFKKDRDIFEFYKKYISTLVKWRSGQLLMVKALNKHMIKLKVDKTHIP